MSKYTEKDLETAGVDMMLRSWDFDDNNGSPDRMEFWRQFEIARDRYRKIKKEVRGE